VAAVELDLFLATSPVTFSWSVTVSLPSRTRSTGTVSVSTTGRSACRVTSCSSSVIEGPSRACLFGAGAGDEALLGAGHRVVRRRAGGVAAGGVAGGLIV
jgi:hypothetical protein